MINYSSYSCSWQAAYLASTLFLDSSSDLVILVVNTIQRDLKSDNFIIGEVRTSCCYTGAIRVTAGGRGCKRLCSTTWQCACLVESSSRDLLAAAVCSALTAVCKLLSVDLVNAVLAAVVELLKHPKELVRKKAVMALHRFEQLDPQHEGPLHNTDVYAHMRDCLCDKVCCRCSGLASFFMSSLSH